MTQGDNKTDALTIIGTCGIIINMKTKEKTLWISKADASVFGHKPAPPGCLKIPLWGTVLAMYRRPRGRAAAESDCRTSRSLKKVVLRPLGSYPILL